MFKYIYVFILIVILFGIKWKLQKKYEFKEEFTVANTLTDMFSSSDGATLPTFYDKLNIINSNIKFDFNTSNLSWNLGTSETIWFQHDTDHYSRIELRPDAQGIGFGDHTNTSSHDKVLTSLTNNILSFQLQRFNLPRIISLSTGSNFAEFDINSNNTSNINESVSNLKSWHNNTDIQWFTTTPFYAYLYKENYKITSSPSWKEDNKQKSIIKPDGTLFGVGANSNRVFSKGISGTNPGTNGVNLSPKEEEINECGNKGLNRCNSSSNCDFVSYFRSSNNTYSYCVLHEFKDIINPENDAVYEVDDRITTWIKSDITLSS